LQLGSCEPEWFDSNSRDLLSSSDTAAPQLRCEVLLLFVQWYSKEGRWEEALALATRAADLARYAHASSLLRRALNNVGMVQSRMRNLIGAVVTYVEALNIADSIGDRSGKAATLANLAEARFNAGLLDESIALNRYVIELSGSEPQMMPIRAGAHHNIAVAALLLNDLDTANLEIRTALEFSSEPRSLFWAHQRVVLETTFTKVLVRLGRFDEARQRADMATTFADKVDSVPARIRANLAHALCEAANGNPDSALTSLEQLKATIRETDPVYRDFLEIELLCNSYAGHNRYAQHYQQKYILDLARFQRESAVAQVAALQRAFRTGGHTSEADLLALPHNVREQMINRTPVCRKGMFREQLEALASLAEQRDDATGEHAVRVGRLVSLLAVELGHDRDHAARLGLASRLHDIGKLAIPDVLLLKRGKLLGKELEIMRRHPTEGCQIISDIIGSMEAERQMWFHEDLSTLRLGAEVALYHHEWWDGSGYPRGIAGSAIPESARIIALADAFDELIHSRPYRTACAIDDAISEITSLSGRQFDPLLCKAFSSVVSRLITRFGPKLEGFAIRMCPESTCLRAKRVIDRIVESARCEEKKT
jgi:HD-GYP domain-containing protein (c-di-GMP phosphodiesterase class II)